MPAAPLTRRRALALGAAAGLSSLLTDVGSARAVVRASSRAAAPRGFGLPLPHDVFGADRRTAVLRAPRRFDVVGIRGAGLAQARLEVRVRRRGRAWSPWVPLGAGGDHRPDTGTGDHASDPVWAGGSDELQLRCARRPRGPLRLHFVTVPAAAKRRGARASARIARAAAARPPQAGASQAGPPPIIPRSEWGGDRVVPRAKPEIGDVQVAFVHHTVSANDYGPEDSAGIVLGMAKYHRDVNGWNDLGYNFVVDKYGQIFEGRAGGIDLAIVGAHAQGYNSHSTGIANIGTFTATGQTATAIEAMARLIAWKLPLHGAPVSGKVVLKSLGGPLNRYTSGTPVTLDRISGHRDGDATECPGDALYAQLPQLRQRTAQLAPAVVAPSAGLAIAMAPPVAEVPYGEQLQLSGSVTAPAGGAVAGQSVTVEKQRGARWVTIARVTADANGAWSASVAWRATGAVRARAAVPGAGAVTTAAVQVACVPLLDAAARTTRVLAGTSLAVSGTVRPLAPITVTVEQQGRDGVFRRVRTVTIKPRRSRFRAKVALREPGLYRLTPHTGRGKAKASASALYVRAVRNARSLRPSSSPSAPSPGAPSPGGVAADV
ncbi:MAG TPA: peptidoglycan recognition protein [Baekduia sp.]|nr:peptidoglycan recognition protein [Baekduia sp.]